MSKLRLILFRHAKSDWDASFNHDSERPINKRGQKAAAQMGKILKKADQVPELAWVSPAVRAQQTFELASQEGGWNLNQETVPELYHSHPQLVLETLRNRAPEVNSLMLVGHEPVWSELCSSLIGEAYVHFPTAAMARIDFQLSNFQDISYGVGKLVWLLQPKLFKDFKSI